MLVAPSKTQNQALDLMITFYQNFVITSFYFQFCFAYLVSTQTPSCLQGGRTKLHLARKGGGPNSTLLARGEDQTPPCLQGGRTKLHLACKGGVKPNSTLLARGEVNQTPPCLQGGRTKIHLARKGGGPTLSMYDITFVPRRSRKDQPLTLLK